MEVYLLRHGLAEERGRDGQADEDRALTRKGAKKVRIMGRWMKAQGIELDLFLTSPLLRARQTLPKRGARVRPRRSARGRCDACPDYA